MTSGCQKPSCAQGCAAATALSSEAACNASCVAAAGKNPGSSGCQYTVPGHPSITFQMCGSCQAVPAPSWWPAAAKPKTDGEHPGFWPPGYSLSDCTSCETINNDPVYECKLGCMFASRPSLKPMPPAPPQPPPSRPPPPPCGVFPSEPGGQREIMCKVGGDFNLSNVFSDKMVLQRAPARSAVYGYIGTNATAPGSAKVTVTVASSSSASSAASASSSPSSYTVDAAVDASKGTWKAFLKPTAAGGDYKITVACSGGGCTGAAQTLSGVTFGDVWYCAGQSNMALPMQYTYARNATIAKIQGGKLGDIRIFGIKGNMNADQPWITLRDALKGNGDKPNGDGDDDGDDASTPASMPAYGSVPLDKFSSTCFYFGEALSEGLAAAAAATAAAAAPGSAANGVGGTPAPIGLIHTAWGGSMIEEWLTNEEIAACKGAAITDNNGIFHDQNVLPFVDMSIKGWAWYQVSVATTAMASPFCVFRRSTPLFFLLLSFSLLFGLRA